jgi:Mn2+/Fe2+ NRAMP family transporter
MDSSRIPRRYKDLSSEDQRTFSRWAKVDAAIGVILVAGLIAMAVAAAALRPEYDATVGWHKTNPGIVASEQNRK